MPEKSAGLLMYRRRGGRIEVFLVHPGGPLWAKKDEGAWSVPKGLYEEGEYPVEAARREFTEETGFPVAGELLPLGTVRMKSGKTVAAWAFEGDADPAALRSNTFKMEWPPRSGKLKEFPEVDRGAWFPLDVAREKIVQAQRPLLDRLEEALGG